MITRKSSRPLDRKGLTIIVVSIVCMVLFEAALFWAASQPNLLGSCSILTPPGCGAPLGILNMETFRVNSPTNMTLNIRNIGRGTTTLVSYNVKDQPGNTFALPNWSGPTIESGELASVNILIDGQVFTFQPGSTYMIEILTSENNYFSFQISL